MNASLAGMLITAFLAPVGQASPVYGWGGPATEASEPLEWEPGEVAVRDPVAGWQVHTTVEVDEWGEFRRAASTSVTHPVFYLRGGDRSIFARRILTGRIGVRLHEGAQGGKSEDPAAAALAADFGLWDDGEVAGAEPWRVMRAEPPERALACLTKLQTDARVAAAEIIWARQMVPRDLPDDPFLPLQWHVFNVLPTADGEAPADLALSTVWGSFDRSGTGWRGRGVRIGILDDGIDDSHPDLGGGRVDQAAGRNWNGGASGNASAQNDADSHGTAVAGIAGASADNSVGIAGVAPEAGLVSLRLTAGAHDDVDEAQAISHLANSRSNPISMARIDIKNASWGPADGRFRLAGPGPLAKQALATAARDGRGGRGTVFIWAAGNGGAIGEDANADGYANNPHVITVGSMDAFGRVPGYSEGGACLAVVAPSGSEDAPPIVTTDRPGEHGFNPPAIGSDFWHQDYTESFGGTSAAAPQVAGVVALMLEANPALGWRDVKEILLRSARRVKPASPAWFSNAVGLRFHPRQGAGLIDAAAATALAADWKVLGPPVELRGNAMQPGAIPDYDDSGLTRTFVIGPSRRVEQAVVRFSANHRYRGDLRVTLTSPGGTTSVLAPGYFASLPDGQAHYNEWEFSSVQFWGENSAGTWTLKVADMLPEESGVYLGAQLTLLAANTLPPPVITSTASRIIELGQWFEHRLAASNGPALFKATGSIPPGCEFDPSSGVLRGNPSEAGEFSVQWTAATASGSATQDFTLTVVAGYDAWRVAAAVPDELAAPDKDADGDGRSNILEYAAGANPMVGESTTTESCALSSEGKIRVSFVRRVERIDLLWQIEFSEDGQAWTPVGESRHGQPTESLVPARFQVYETDQTAETRLVQVSPVAPASPVHGWFRLKVRLDP